ncbi:MAG TPA: dethiobiotin synthase [Acidimicrobiales bacterium]|nr:dethiobiotin synthase [Acidimicrobiales bacterium]
MTSSTRPSRVVAVAGTATEVGKTWVTARLIESLRAAGLRVAARKPAQSFEAVAGEPTDADVLAAASGEAPHEVCPAHRWYGVPMAPPMAADVLGLDPPTLADLVGELAWPAEPTDVGFVETVGGVRSPVATDADSRDLAIAIEPDHVVLVAHAGLGTIDSVRLGIDALAQLRVTVLLNRFDPDDDLHQRNLTWLVDRDGFDVTSDLGLLGGLVAR